MGRRWRLERDGLLRRPMLRPYAYQALPFLRYEALGAKRGNHMSIQAEAAIRGWETRRSLRPPDKVNVTFSVPRHFRDALKAEADVRNMSVHSFMRAMIRGYFAAALHGR